MLRTELIRPLPEILTEHATLRGGKIAFSDSRRQVTYAELESRTGRIAGHLTEMRVQPGDRAAMYLGNCVEMVESYLAITRANAIGVPLNPHSTDAELRYLLTDSGARVVITDSAHVEQVTRVLDGARYPRIVVTGQGRVPAGTTSFEALATTEPAVSAKDDLGLDEIAWMLYTSGTTGKPKGVLSTQRNCLWSVAACYVPVPELTEADRVLWPLPLFHSLSHIACVLAVTAVGASARITDGYSADEVLSALREESPTFLAGVPTMYHQLVQAARQNGFRAPDLRIGIVGGAVTTAALRASFEETFGVSLLDAYGSTETCGSITINWPTGARVEGSCGLPVPGLNVRLVDPETGLDVPTGGEGEVWVSGPSVMAGYHNRPDETATALRDGWYHTGDLARRDDAGYFTISGRIKELIIRGGENIHPGEVEDVLRGVPGVADVAVVGKAHDVLGEVPVAFLVPGPEGLDPEALFAACRDQLSYFKVPEELYEIARVPRTRSGKTTRHVLLDEPARLRATGGGYYESLFRTDWVPLPACPAAPRLRWLLVGEVADGLADGIEAAGGEVTRTADPTADVVVLQVESGVDDRVSEAVAGSAAVLRSWLADERFTSARLLVLTHDGVRARLDEAPDPRQAASAGLVSGLQARHDGRLVLVDVDADDSAAGSALPTALAAGEPRLAVRAGSVLKPALERLSTNRAADTTFDSTRTVVIAGADTAAGAVTARHLVTGHGVRHLLLIADQGRDDPAVAALAAELTEHGSVVTAKACDVSDRDALAAVLAGNRRPLSAVVYAPAAMASFGSVVAGAVNFRELTADADLAAFVLLSSIDAALGIEGDAEYGAIAGFLDAFALRLRDQGQPALSFALGPWADDTDPVRAERRLPAGVGTLSRRDVLAMLDAAVMAGEAVVAPVRLDTMGLHGDSVPALLRGLIDTTAAGSAADAGRAGDLRAELAGLPEAERLRTLVATVCAAAAAIGGVVETAIPPRRAFKEIGFSSVQAVQLRNRLVEITGLRLPATLAFDHPTPHSVANFVLAELLGGTAEQFDVSAQLSATDDPIVIVGMTCRLPGGIASPEDLWEFVDQGLDGITGFPADRGWDVEGIYDPDPELTGKTYVRDGGFLHDATGFDATFFGISPREALAMDPQQRVFLEAAWELFERAGIDVTDLRGSRTGVFAGVMNQEYGTSLAGAADETEGYQSTGSASSVVSGRVSYSFGFEGPAVTVDTACSSSLVALHLAAQSLRSGECDLALAGGVAVMVRPSNYVEFSRQRGLAADGRCKAFAAGADGTGWSEGVSLLLLERLSDARRNGHGVLAVVRGSAVNQDGASNGLTAPNGPSQQRVIRQALVNAGLVSADVDVVEAHGTGTTLGDPIEAQALIATYGQDRAEGLPLWLGSLKSNIGHTQAAAGVAGVIKSVLAMRRGVVPRTLHVDAPSPHVDWSAGAVELATESVAWPETGRARRTGISAFGVSGTNAHVIIEGAPPVEDVPVEAGEGATPWILSANSPAALTQVADRLLGFAEGHPDLTAAELAGALERRARLDHRAVVVGTDRDGLLGGLRSLADDVPDPAVISGPADVEGKTVFVFPGQGTQWVGMGAGLLDSSKVFADSVAECEVVLSRFVDWSVVDVIRQAESAPPLDRVDVLQPVSFVMMVSLARMWQHHGVRPDAVLGHSQGEIAAAFVAGALSLEDAVRVVALRSQVIGRELAGFGAMMSVPLPLDVVESRIEEFDGRLQIATVNGPASVVVAGDQDAVRGLHSAYEAEGVRARRIAVDYASHTAHVERIRPELAGLLGDVEPLAPRIPMYSTVNGAWVDGPELTGDYWFRNLRQTVRFQAAVEALVQQHHHVFVEVSTHPVLTVAIEDTLELHAVAHPDTLTVPTLRRDHDEPTTLCAALARLHTRTGAPIDWHLPAVVSDVDAPLPSYPFQHERYWPEAARALDAVVDPTEARFWSAVDQDDLVALTDTLDVSDAESKDAVASALPTLSSWRRRTRQGSTVDSWRYRVTWRRLGTVASARLSGKWLAVVPEGFADDTHVVTTLDALRSTGAECALLEIAEADRTALEESLRSSGVADAGYAGVLSFLAVDERPHPEFPATPIGVVLLAALVPALAGVGLTAPLWSITTGGTDDGVADAEIRPVQALTWGFGLVAALEYPQGWGGLVDLPVDADDRSLRRLSGVLRGQGDEDQIAIRADGVFGRRLVRAPLGGTAARKTWTPRGTVLVTGGTGGVGGQIARWLATAGADHLVLVGRRGLDGDGVPELVAELTGLGVEVTTAACDVTDRTALAAVVAAIPQDRPLTAVVHAAGVGQRGSIADTTPAEFARILAGKVDGARNLDEVLSDRPLDAFVLISSNAGVWGGGGQGAYAAANAYLDSLATRRRQLGRVATSIAWGSWGGAGLGAVDGAADRLRLLGVSPMEPRLAVSALVASIEHDETAVSIADIDWARFAPGFSAARPSPLLGELPEVQAALRDPETDGGNGKSGSDLAGRLATLPEADREREVLGVVLAHAAAVLGHKDPSVVDPDTAFTEQGFDSMTAVQLRNALVKDFGFRLPTTLLFDHPTATVLARFVLAELVGTAAGPAQVVATTVVDDDPVVIVGMTCRLPGGITSPEDLWELLSTGGDALTDFPTDRGWDVEGIYDPEPGLPGKTYTRTGGFLDGATEFDPAFFKISPREALGMDPQQRIFLEAAWELFERSGVDVTALKGSKTGVFAGAFHTGYTIGADLIGEGVDGYASHNNLPSVLSGRVSYSFGFEGPAVTVDTACSSSLVALHLAAQSLRSGECDLALAGGVAVMVRPSTFVEFSRQRGLAVDGRCKAFAAGADGTGWSEGVSLLLLERLSDARRNGHGVLAVVSGSAVNQDGASNGLTAPNGPSQQRVIRQALANSGLSTSDVDVVEAHGTGTTLGDPIEAQALIATYGQDRAEGLPLWLGSLKSNIGHTQAASGVSGVIKSVLSMRRGVLPRTLHVDAPTPHVEWSAGAVRLLTESVAWPETGRARRAGISAFGVSGTNAHVIIEQAPETPAVEVGTPDERAATPWILSAKTPAALVQVAERLVSHLELHPDLTASEIGGALAGRARLDHRAVVVGTDRDGLLDGLRSLADDVPDPAVVTGVSGVTGKTVFVFPGQGTQWVGMGAGLLDSSKVFADSVAECDAVLSRFVDWSVVDVLRQADSAPSLDRVDVVQPVSFVMMVSLARMWQHHGVRPDAVLGHSQGEIAAAFVAGALSLEDAVRVVALRSQTIGRELAGLGAMMSVPLPLDVVESRIEELDGLEIATVNGPASVVVAGDREAVDALHAVLEAEGLRARKIPVDYASHTSHVERVRGELADLLAEIEPKTPRIPMFSTVNGAWVDGPELTGDYWFRNLRQTVRFQAAVEALVQQHHHVFVEVSTHPVLTTAVEDALELHADAHPETLTVPTLRRDKDEPTTLCAALARLHTRTGAPIDWHLPVVVSDVDVPLPSYPFQRQRYWLKTDAVTSDIGTVGLDGTGHPLLGAVVHLPDSAGVLFTNRISVATQPWLADHVVSGVVLVPGTALLELVVRAGDELGAAAVVELVIESPLVLPERDAVDLRVTVGEPDASGLRSVAVHSRADAGWTRHVTGSLGGDPVSPVAVDKGGWPPAGAEPVAVDDFYPNQRAAGFEFGPLFQGLRAAWTRDDEVFAEVGLPEDADLSAAFLLHPALLDAALHAAAFLPGRGGPDAPARLPFAWTGVAVHATGATELRVRIRLVGADDVALEVSDAAGAPVASIASLTMRPVDPRQLAAPSGAGGSLFRMDWVARPVSPDAVSVPGPVLDLTTSLDSLMPERARVLVNRALAEVQQHLDRSGTGAPLVVLTRDAKHDPAMAAVWGLIRTAQSENPDQVVLVDLDDSSESGRLLSSAVATGEPQLALHAGAVTVPRLTRTTPGTGGRALDADGTVLITGGTGTLGGLVARRLVTHHGVRHLLLTSRRGPDAPDADGLQAELTALGATVTMRSCDIGDGEATAALVAGIPVEHPLTAVIHTAAVLDDGVLTTLDADRVDTVFGPKVDGAWFLHELTKDLDLAAFVLFSSASGTVGNAGQGNYAAGNGFLDGLAEHRRGLGLAGLSLAWGLWEQASEMTGELLDGSRGHLKHDVLALGTEEAMSLFDAALGGTGLPDEPAVLVPIELDLDALRQSANLPAVLRGLVPPTRPSARRGTAPAESLVDQLGGLSPAEQVRKLLDLVRTHTAATLGHTNSAAISDGQAFRDLGFDSLAAVDLRNRVGAATGLRLPATLVFDYPTPTALVHHLRDELGGTEESASDRVLAELDKLEAALDDMRASSEESSPVAARLRELAARWRGPAHGADLDLASDEDIFQFADAELGQS